MEMQGRVSEVAQKKNSRRNSYYLSLFATNLGKERCQGKLLLQPGRGRRKTKRGEKNSDRMLFKL